MVRGKRKRFQLKSTKLVARDHHWTESITPVLLALLVGLLFLVVMS
jgi:hypothetical protein